ncbi:hypothetical protein EYR36_005080 [Pleurotus pulmonarius]|nr:hypothetical protein EYR36_005080 [Pleurotus pulmonarius]
MSTTQEEQNVYVAIKFIESRNLPSDKKKKDKKRHFYAVLSIEGRSDAKFELHGLGAQDEKAVDFPMIFFAKLSTIIEIELYESKNDNDQILLAHSQVPLCSLDGEGNLKATADSGLQTDLILGFVSDTSSTLSEEQAESEIKALETRLKSRPKLASAFEHVRLFLTIGAAIAELNSFAKVAFGVVTAIASAFDKYLDVKAQIISLLEDIGAVCSHVRGLDARKDGNSRSKQHAACQALFPIIYKCLHFICSLRNRDLFEMTLIGTIKNRVDENANLLKRALDAVKSAHQQDTQEAVFKTLYAIGDLTAQVGKMADNFDTMRDKIDEMHQHSDKEKILAELPSGRITMPPSCLEGTRTAVLDFIEKWGQDQTAKKLLLLRGAAGKGKSTILSTMTDEYTQTCLDHEGPSGQGYIRIPDEEEHIQSSQDFENEIQVELKNFLKENFLYWLEAHSCMGTWQHGPGTILPSLHKWTLFMGIKDLELIVSDFMKFEKMFREGYMASAPQVYYSGLISHNGWTNGYMAT